MPNHLAQYFENKDSVVREVYEAFIQQLQKEIGGYELQYKNTSIHIVAKSAFLGIHFMKSALVLNIVLDHALESQRIHKVEKVSANRFHNEVRLNEPHQVDKELLIWIKEAYRLKS